jgi:hypothetical protein
VNEQTFHVKYQLASDFLGCLELRNDHSHTLDTPLLVQITEQRILVRIAKTLKDSSARGLADVQDLRMARPQVRVKAVGVPSRVVLLAVG